MVSAASLPVEKASKEPWLVAAWFGLAVLVIASVFSGVNNMILLLAADSLKQDLALSDTQIGALNGIALTFVAVLASYPMGWLADRINRVALLCICVLVWSASTAAVGFTQTFPQLFVAAMGTAVGEAVLGPIVYSMIPDLFPANRRVLANYIFYVSAVLGGSAGLFLSGTLIGFIEANRDTLALFPADFETWRVAIILSAIPGPAIALMVAMIRLPQRHIDKAAEKVRGLTAYARDHWRTLFSVYFGFGLIAAGRGTLGIWGTIAMVRVFGESQANTGIRLGIITAIASVIGVTTSGLLYRSIHKRVGSLASFRVAQYGMWAALFIVPLYLFSASAVHMYVIGAALQIAMTIGFSLSPTILQEIAPPHLRGRVIALGGLVYIMLLSLSPVVVGMVSDVLPSDPRSLLWAMVMVSLPCFVAGAFILRTGERNAPRTLAVAAEA